MTDRICAKPMAGLSDVCCNRKEYAASCLHPVERLRLQGLPRIAAQRTMIEQVGDIDVGAESSAEQRKHIPGIEVELAVRLDRELVGLTGKGRVQPILRTDALEHEIAG